MILILEGGVEIPKKGIGFGLEALELIDEGTAFR